MTIQATPDVIRAWTDEEYRRTLSHDDLALFPMHPAGDIALLDADIRAIYGTDPKMVEHWVRSTDITYCITVGSCYMTENGGTYGPCCPVNPQ